MSFINGLSFPFLTRLITFFLDTAASIAVLDAATAAAPLVVFRRPPPDADHVVGGDGDDVRVVVGGGNLIDDDIVTVEGNLPGVFEVVVLQLGPHEPGREEDFFNTGTVCLNEVACRLQGDTGGRLPWLG